MDFFEAQAQARRRTRRLVWLFALAVLGTVLACYAAAFFIAAIARDDGYGHARPARSRSSLHAPARNGTGADAGLARVGAYWDPLLFVGVAGTVLTIVGGASLVKWGQLRAGGSAVAEMVGGRRVSPTTSDPQERRLLNVVEEMAIAAGLPVPAVYVLPEEPAINAFAAGLTPRDAVVAVTEGTLEKLTRDELQGVVAHEFSHILNGDMRLNVRLLAILFGILVLGLIGRGILRGMLETRLRLGSNRKGGGAVIVIALMGAALFVIGMVGYFFGRLIQSAVSRQREYLADAAAVQFTRHPLGLAGALRKIGGAARGAELHSHRAAEIGHFFFAQGVHSWFDALFATHPPLAARIRAIDPSWDGQYAAPTVLDDILDRQFGRTGASAAPPPPRAAPAPATAQDAPPPLSALPAGGFLAHPPTRPPDVPPAGAAAPTAAAAPGESLPFAPAAVIATAGTLDQEHYDRAQRLLARVPAAVLEAARDPHHAPAVIFTLLLAAEPARRQEQMRQLRQREEAATVETMAALEPAIAALPVGLRLILVQLAAPALQALSPTAAQSVRRIVPALIQADARVTPFELALERLIARALEPAAAAAARKVEFRHGADVTAELAVVLATLAQAGDKADADAQSAYAKGAAHFAATLHLTLPPLASGARLAAQADLTAFGQALDRLARAGLPIKKRLLEAAAHVVECDGRVERAEAETYRALAAVLDCPMPVWPE